MPNKPKKMPKFYIILIVCWILALSALAVLLINVRAYLENYESVQPKYLAQDVFDEYFREPDFKAMIEFSDLNKSKYETNEMLASYLTELTEGKKLSYHNVSSGLDLDVSKYTVKYTEDGKDIKIASFQLEKSGEKSEKGFDKYALSGFELFYPAEKSVSVKVIKGATPYINGIPLEAEHIAQDNIEHESFKHMPKGTEGISYTLYKIQGLTTEPIIDVKDKNGIDLELFENTKEDCYETEIIYDSELAAEQSSHVIAAAQTYAAYMQNDAKLAKLTPYFEKNTELYNSIKSTLQWAVIDHDSYHFENVEASEFYRYDENTFSCRVKFDHILKRSRLQDHVDHVDITLYLRNVDGKYLVYERTNN